MVTKSSKLYPAVKLCHSMVSYYNPSYLDFLTDSEYDFIQLYKLKKMTSEESLRYYSYISSLFSSNYDDCVRLRKFFYINQLNKFKSTQFLHILTEINGLFYGSKCKCFALMAIAIKKSPYFDL